MKSIGVECSFMVDGSVEIQQIRMNDRWHPIEQGRQWVDETGRHVLVRLLGGDAVELTLSRDTLDWQLVTRAGNKVEIV